MVVNGKDLLTVFYDKLQKREVLYAEESRGLWGHRSINGKQELLEIVDLKKRLEKIHQLIEKI